MSETGHRSAHIDLPPAPETSARARRFVRQILEAWSLDDPDDVSILLASEIVTNAMRHASTSVRLELTVRPDGVLVVRAGDDHPGVPVVETRSLDHEQGRGMVLVAALAEKWGADVGPDGSKLVWFQLSLPRSSPQRTGATGAVAEAALAVSRTAGPGGHRLR